MKNIVICFDGTWNSIDAQYPTNVVKTAQMISARTSSNVAQVVFYDQGVGSSRTPFASSINQLLGGAFGAGLLDNIEDAYRFLNLNYAPGDRIYLFGFSRGAFSARSFGGLLRTCGILRKEHIAHAQEALDIYQHRDAKAGADAPNCTAFRAQYAIASSSPGDGQHPLAVQYVGVWDTVGSLGIPAGFVFADTFNQRYQFHDLSLSRIVQHARHAIAIDERRLTFKPTLWDNLDTLNEAASNASRSLDGGQPYLQQWFPGDHATIGGGGDVNGLWQASLVWVVEGAIACGLGVDPQRLEEYRTNIRYGESVRCMKRPVFTLSSISFLGWRRGPDAGHEKDVSDIAQQRIAASPEKLFEKRPYRPRSLKKVLPAILGRSRPPAELS